MSVAAPMSDLQLAETASLLELRECPDCGLFQRLPSLRPGQVADCERCGATLRRRRRDSFGTTLALMLAGLCLFSVTLSFPLITLRAAGIERQTTLEQLPMAFQQFGMWELSILVLGTTLIAPLLKLGLTAGVLIGLRGEMKATHLAAMARIRSWLTPWSMTEVFLLGMFVAYTRLTAIATVQVGIALAAQFGLMLVMVAADAWLDEHAMWDAIGRRRGVHAPAGHGHAGLASSGQAGLASSGHAGLLSCDTCDQVSRAEPGAPCPRCDATLRARKPEPVVRCWALLVSAAVLYLPANFLPVLTAVRLGQGHPSTILGGVVELIELRMWPLALLVFVASIAVPMIKLVLLAYMLMMTQFGSAAGLEERTRLYRFVDVIGRWSMIDVFMIAILTALVQMGLIANVTPGNGAVCFAGVVVLTMLAAFSFDPRVMWDAAGARARAAAGAPASA